MFGMGFTEIMIIAVIAILFLGPDKLPTAMVEVAKFFRNAKNTIGNVKDSLEQEMNVADIKEEALAYKKQLLTAGEEVKKATNIKEVAAEFSGLSDLTDLTSDSLEDEKPKEKPKAEKITFEKKSTKKEENIDV